MRNEAEMIGAGTATGNGRRQGQAQHGRVGRTWTARRFWCRARSPASGQVTEQLPTRRQAGIAGARRRGPGPSCRSRTPRAASLILRYRSTEYHTVCVAAEVETCHPPPLALASSVVCPCSLPCFCTTAGHCSLRFALTLPPHRSRALLLFSAALRLTLPNSLCLSRCPASSSRVPAHARSPNFPVSSSTPHSSRIQRRVETCRTRR